MLAVGQPPYTHRHLDHEYPQKQQVQGSSRSASRTPRSVYQPGLDTPDPTFEAFTSATHNDNPNDNDNDNDIDIDTNAPMNTDTWSSMAQVGRLPHQRESSLSSMGSTGPASPYNHNTSNPKIAISDSTGDDLSEMHAQDASQNGAMFPMNKPVGNPYSGYHNIDQTIPEMAYPVTIPGPEMKASMDRGLLPAPELSGSNRSHPASVASSVAGGNSPTTPNLNGEGVHHVPNQKRRTDAYGNVPKLDRTMTDVYGDELYSPNFTITSTPPSQSQPQVTALSPTSDVFSQRLNAANTQHLNVGRSPAASMPAGRSSPFRPNSPFAKSANQSFDLPPQPRPSSQAQNARTTATDQVFPRQNPGGIEPETPKTISPKDAILEFNEQEGEADFPLFPQNVGLDIDMSKMIPTHAHPPQFMAGGNGLINDQFNYMPSQLPASIQVPQQYPFVARMQTSSNGSPPRLSSSGSSSDSGESAPVVRPPGTAAEGGTYTCTYHGCTLRFETPALLQKHKREGHRQSHGLMPTHTDLGLGMGMGSGMTSNLLNSQAGPHRCDRINPSTGKPCATVFSRPYDLTRHEDTIHNARKQKVRCDLCTEEKTFSRADALTRHYRVCHPDMELPGKHRRRGAA